MSTLPIKAVKRVVRVEEQEVEINLAELLRSKGAAEQLIAVAENIPYVSFVEWTDNGYEGDKALEFETAYGERDFKVICRVYLDHDNMREVEISILEGGTLLESDAILDMDSNDNDVTVGDLQDVFEYLFNELSGFYG